LPGNGGVLFKNIYCTAGRENEVRSKKEETGNIIKDTFFQAKFFTKIKNKAQGTSLKSQGTRYKDQASRYKAQGTRTKAQGSRFKNQHKDQEPRHKNQDARIKVQVLGNKITVRDTA
jgi:hypothetical protein